MQRLKYLDGIRGIMAIDVILHHFVIVFCPVLYYVQYGGCWAKSPFAILNNGNIAVQFFFVLSGFLIVAGNINHEVNVRFICRKMLERYFRLLPVIVAATIFSYTLMKMGFMFHLDLDGYVRQFEMVKQYNCFKPGIRDCLYNAFVKTFIDSNDYVGPFWTIKWEMEGYLLLLVLSLLRKKKSIYYAINGVIFVLLYFKAQNLMPFILGGGVAEMWIHGPDWMRHILMGTLKSFIGLAGLYFMTVPQEYAGIHDILNDIPGSANVWRAIGVSIVMGIILYSPLLQHFLENKFILFLGKISFELYALHWPVILSLGSFVYLRELKKSGYTGALCETLCVVLTSSVVCAFVLHQILKKLTGSENL